jgi:hypothetical protein
VLTFHTNSTQFDIHCIVFNYIVTKTNYVVCCRANNKVEIDVCDDGLKLLCEKTDELVSFKKENPEYLVSMVSRVAKNGTTTQLSEK